MASVINWWCDFHRSEIHSGWRVLLAEKHKTVRILQGKRSVLFQDIGAFNFIQWVDTQVNVQSDFYLNEARAVYGGWFDVL